MSTTAVVFDGLSLADSASLGGRWKVTSIEGWYGRTTRRDLQDKAQQDGAWPSTGHDTAPQIIVRGVALFSDAATCKQAARTLTVAGGNGLTEMMVEDSLGALTRMVELDGCTVSPVNQLEFGWSLQVTAPDPLLYGPPTFDSTTLASTAAGAGLTYPLTYPLDYGVAPGVTPGAVTLSNEGTHAYWPRLRIDGPVPNPVVTLVETGDWIRYGGTVLAGQWLDVDCANRRVLLNGQVSVRQAVTSAGSWLAVPVGGGSVSWTADAADPAASLGVWGYQGAWT